MKFYGQAGEDEHLYNNYFKDKKWENIYQYEKIKGNRPNNYLLSDEAEYKFLVDEYTGVYGTTKTLMVFSMLLLKLSLKKTEIKH